MREVFRGQLTQQEGIPSAAIARAVEVMESGRLHRYNTFAGEASEASLLELEFRAYTGSRYCLAVSSCGYALTTALRAAGLAAGAPVLSNGFTLSPVPGAIVAAGGRPVLVDTTDELVIDLADLAAKIDASGAGLLLLSHMRGHLADMDALMALCGRAGVAVIEDCAHTMGATWGGLPSGRHGLAACYSTQTYKHLNSGEGGLIVSDDPALMATATILSGSYMLYGRHPAGPPAEHYAELRLTTPNCSGRMDNLRAAILRPQLAALGASVARWNERHVAVAAELAGVPGLVLPHCHPRAQRVGSSIQFRLPHFGPAAMHAFLARCLDRGVELKWFGAPEPVAYTSAHHSWRFIEAQSLPHTDRVLATLCDMRLPLTLSIEDCRLLGCIIRESVLDTLDALPDDAPGSAGALPETA